MHVVKTNTGRQIQVEWGTYAMFLFCQDQKIDLQGFANKMASLQFDLGTLIALFQTAVVANGQPKPDVKEVCEWIDECGGVLKQDGPLHDFLNYVIERTVLKTTDKEAEEKKS